MELTQAQILLIGFALILAYLLYSGALTPETFLLFGGSLIVLFWVSKREKRIISIDEARKIAKEFVRKIQHEGEIPDGTIYLMPESELKSVIVESSEPIIEPYRYNVGIIVEGIARYAYLVKVSIYGNVIGITRIKRPTAFRITKEPEILPVRAKPIITEKIKKKEEEEEEHE